MASLISTKFTLASENMAHYELTFNENPGNIRAFVRFAFRDSEDGEVTTLSRELIVSSRGISGGSGLYLVRGTSSIPYDADDMLSYSASTNITANRITVIDADSGDTQFESDVEDVVQQGRPREDSRVPEPRLELALEDMMIFSGPVYQPLSSRVFNPSTGEFSDSKQIIRRQFEIGEPCTFTETEIFFPGIDFDVVAELRGVIRQEVSEGRLEQFREDGLVAPVSSNIEDYGDFLSERMLYSGEATYERQSASEDGILYEIFTADNNDLGRDLPFFLVEV